MEAEKDDNRTLEAAYWDDVFRDHTAGGGIEWLLSWRSAGRFWAPSLPTDPAAVSIAVGTGNSTFPLELHAEGFCPQLACSDFSAEVIAQMNAAPGARSGCTFCVEDARKLSYASGSVDCYLDKSLFDCMYWAAEREKSLSNMVREAWRVLKPGGVALIMTQRTPYEVAPYLCQQKLVWSSVEFVPIAAKCDNDANMAVLPGAPACVEHLFDNYFGPEDFFEIVFLYICRKAACGGAASAAVTPEDIRLVDDATMTRLYEFPPRDAEGNEMPLREQTRKRSHEEGGPAAGDDRKSDDRKRPRRALDAADESAPAGSDAGDDADADSSDYPAVCAFADSIPMLLQWGKCIRLSDKLDAENGIVVLDDFLPETVANQARAMLRGLPDGKWSLNADAGANDDTPHSFMSCASARDPAFSALLRCFWALLPDRMPSFSVAKYGQADHIALHDDAMVLGAATTTTTRAEGDRGGSGDSRADGAPAHILSRDVALAYYLVDDEWDTNVDGGEFLDWGPTTEKFESPVHHAAKFNRLVAFRVPRWHEVTAVMATRPRLSVFGWFLAEGDLYEE